MISSLLCFENVIESDRLEKLVEMTDLHHIKQLRKCIMSRQNSAVLLTLDFRGLIGQTLEI